MAIYHRKVISSIMHRLCNILVQAIRIALALCVGGESAANLRKFEPDITGSVIPIRAGWMAGHPLR